jgi:hypothetical protein
MKLLDLTTKGENAVRQCLASVPFLRVVRITDGATGTDFIAQVKAGDRTWNLLAEVRGSGQPRALREAASQLHACLAPRSGAYGVLVAPFISADGARVCEEAGLGYVDLAGNCRLAFGTVFIEKQGRPNPLPARRDLLSIYRPRAARILRALLADPKRQWRMKGLAAEAGVSLGHVANVKQALLGRELAAAGPEGIRLTKPGALLAEWAENYDLRQREARDYYSLDGPAEVESRLPAAAGRVGSKVALTGFSAAARLAPFVKYQRATAYVTGDEEAVARDLGLKKVESGANVTLLIPADEGVFYGVSEIEGVPVVSPIQAYLDLASFRGRGEEAAQFLLDRVIKPKW